MNKNYIKQFFNNDNKYEIDIFRVNKDKYDILNISITIFFTLILILLAIFL